MPRLWLTLAAAGCLATTPDRPAPPVRPVAPPDVVAAGSGPADPAADPVRFMVESRDKAKAGLRGYRATMTKRERLGGTLHPPEEIAASVRLEPYAVRLRWYAGGRDVLGSPVVGLVYAAGANGGRVTAWRPAARFLTLLDVAPTDAAARGAARYAVTEASLVHAADRTVQVWAAARAAGRLDVTYHGRRADPEVGGRACHVFTRRCDPPEVDGFLLADPPLPPGERPDDAVATARLWVDAEAGFQLGAELRRADGELVGSYFFRGVERNPAFGPAEFTRAGLAE